MASTLDHLEKTLADAYRKEIDQEENIWRSLPFFVATLALELAALFRMLDKIRPDGSEAWIGTLVCIAFVTFSTLIALLFLLWSIFPVNFQYVAAEPGLMDFVLGLDHDEAADRVGQVAEPLDAVAAFKTVLARQYAQSTHHNRTINQRRALRRSVAGVATLLSVLATLLLVILATPHYLLGR